MKKIISTIIINAVAATGALAHESTENNNRTPAEEVTKVQAPVKNETKPTAHSGGTDSNGCHTNHSTGEYHCHNRK